MRITVACGRFPATSETFVLTQVASFIEQGHEVNVIATRAGPGPTHAIFDQHRMAELVCYRPRRSVPVDSARAAIALLKHPLSFLRTLNIVRFGRKALSLRLALSAVPWLDQSRPDVVICHFGPNAAVLADLREAGVFEAPLIAIFHGSDIDPTHAHNYRRLLRGAELLLVVNSGFRDRLIEWGASPERVRVFHMGVDLDCFPFREQQSIGMGPIKLSTVARLIPIKGIDVALRAIAALPSALRQRIEYEVIGDGPMRSELQSIAGELGLSSQVHFAGSLSQDEVARRLEASHLFILPSIEMPDGKVEGMGVALMEAMARGVPVLGSRSGGIQELITDRNTGLLFPQADSGALAESLTWAIKHEAELHEYARAARAHVEREHDARTQASRLVEMIQSMQT